MAWKSFLRDHKRSSADFTYRSATCCGVISSVSISCRAACLYFERRPASTWATSSVKDFSPVREGRWVSPWMRETMVSNRGLEPDHHGIFSQSFHVFRPFDDAAAGIDDQIVPGGKFHGHLGLPVPEPRPPELFNDLGMGMPARSTIRASMPTISNPNRLDTILPTTLFPVPR